MVRSALAVVFAARGELVTVLVGVCHDPRVHGPLSLMNQREKVQPHPDSSVGTTLETTHSHPKHNV